MPVAEFSEAQFQFDLVSELTRRNRRQRSGTFHPTTNLEPDSDTMSRCTAIIL